MTKYDYLRWEWVTSIRCGFKSQLYHLIARWSWSSYFTSLSLSFLIYTGRVKLPLEYHFEDWDHAGTMLPTLTHGKHQGLVAAPVEKSCMLPEIWRAWSGFTSLFFKLVNWEIISKLQKSCKNGTENTSDYYYNTCSLCVYAFIFSEPFENIT